MIAVGRKRNPDTFLAERIPLPVVNFSLLRPYLETGVDATMRVLSVFRNPGSRICSNAGAGV